MKRSELGPGAKSLERGSTFAAPRSELKRTSTPARTTRPRLRAISPASKAQRDKVAGMACIVCAHGPCHPAHVIDRSHGGCDDPLCVVPLCPHCHRRYDEGDLDLTPYLEPRFRDEAAHAVGHAGLLRALHRLTNRQWEPIGETTRDVRST